MSPEIHELDPVLFLTAPWLAWQPIWKKGHNKIRSFNWYQYVNNDRKKVSD